MRPLGLTVLVAVLAATPALAFFEFFTQGDDGGQQEQRQQRQQQQQQQQQSGYICPSVPVCVASPAECPCASSTDLKCMVGDWYVCLSPGVPPTCESLGGVAAKA
ncbi:hypothetical protein HK105_202014 [Polyrhizophydium stewartii]|uniref:Long chronological lifespan protein 2 n=1 Tax=Polyrhizophydium stewartii TaxID=2732419 RepID=A0ABR4NGF4_9FUNG